MKTFRPTLLFVAQRVDGIEPRCLSRGVETKKYANHSGNAEREDHGVGRDHDRPLQESLHELGGTNPDPDAQQPAADGQGDGFEEELQQDVAALGADGHANADLAGALGDAHEHDVHDADATDEQGDRGNRKEQRAQDAHLLRLRLGDLFLRAHLEVGILPRLNAMALAKIGLDLVLRLLDLTGRDSRGLNHVDAGLAGKPLHDRGVGGADGVVLILPHHVAALLLQYAHYLDGDILDANHLPDTIAVGKEVVDDSLAEDADLRPRLDVRIGEKITLSDVPGADQGIVDADALHGCAPVQLTGHELPGGPNQGRDIGDGGALLFHPLGIFRSHRRLAGENACAALCRSAGEDHDVVRA